MYLCLSTPAHDEQIMVCPPCTYVCMYVLVSISEINNYLLSANAKCSATPKQQEHTNTHIHIYKCMCTCIW